MDRNLKRTILRSLGSLDYAARVINGKRHLPPLYLRWDVGPLRAFESDAAEFRILLRWLAGLRSESSILDIGCGCGQMALELSSFLGPGARYTGCDINPAAIRWCERHIAAHDGRFSFSLMDVQNGLYNPRGLTRAAKYRFPQGWPPFSVILVKSVFTHMLREAVENYLAQIPSLLSDHGTCMATFFLLNDEQRTLTRKGKSLIRFVESDNGTGYADPRVPERIVAFDERHLVEMLERAGLVVEPPIRYGAWSGRMDCLSHQDILLLRKKS